MPSPKAGAVRAWTVGLGGGPRWAWVGVRAGPGWWPARSALPGRDPSLAFSPWSCCRAWLAAVCIEKTVKTIDVVTTFTKNLDPVWHWEEDRWTGVHV